MSDLLAEYRPIGLWQRIVAALMALAGVPLISLALLVVLHGIAPPVAPPDNPLAAPPAVFGGGVLGSVRFALTLGAAAYSGTWWMFLLLVPLTSILQPALFQRHVLVTAALGALICCVGLLASQAFLSLLVEGLGMPGTVLGTLSIRALVVGALYGIAYWLILRLLFLRRLAPVEDTFS